MFRLEGKSPPNHLLHHPHEADGVVLRRALPPLALHLIPHPGKRDGVSGLRCLTLARSPPELSGVAGYRGRFQNSTRAGQRDLIHPRRLQVEGDSVVLSAHDTD